MSNRLNAKLLLVILSNFWNYNNAELQWLATFIRISVFVVQTVIKINENIPSIFHNKVKTSKNDARVMNLDSLFMSTYEKSYQNTL